MADGQPQSPDRIDSQNGDWVGGDHMAATATIVRFINPSDLPPMLTVSQRAAYTRKSLCGAASVLCALVEVPGNRKAHVRDTFVGRE